MTDVCVTFSLENGSCHGWTLTPEIRRVLVLSSVDSGGPVTTGCPEFTAIVFKWTVSHNAFRSVFLKRVCVQMCWLPCRGRGERSLPWPTCWPPSCCLGQAHAGGVWSGSWASTRFSPPVPTHHASRRSVRSTVIITGPG